MGRNRRGNHRSNFVDLIWEERHPLSDPQDDPHLRFQPPPRGLRDSSQRFNNPLKRRQYPRNQPWINSQHANSNRPNALQKVHRVDQIFLTKSKRLKEYLVRSLNAALNQIEQWYPEANEDEMDWQHEDEILVDQPQEASYAWATPSQGGERASLKVAGHNIPRRSSFSEGLRAAGFGDGKQWNSSPKLDCRKEFFRKERIPTSDLSGPVNKDSEIV
ncbi:hypothetical protein BKA65DRAFT_184244 [Rhexocercosporidium sp. MPI-PUGE-AT-0058]|nr:hypothetical protein BKA65DRAFT_184244 [Rhexocercosporidium sp. MPI-PUGE-AT-0058]